MLVLVLSTMLTATGAVMTYRDRGWYWASAALTCATVVLGLGGIVEALVFRVPTRLILSDRRKLKLPPVGGSLGELHPRVAQAPLLAEDLLVHQTSALSRSRHCRQGSARDLTGWEANDRAFNIAER
jgi:hypothetical protein